MNTTTTIKHVTIIEPPTRPSASIDDFSRTTKTASGQFFSKINPSPSYSYQLDFLTTATTTSDTTRDLNNAYRQTISSMPTTRTSRILTFDPKKKIQQQQKPTSNKKFD